MFYVTLLIINIHLKLNVHFNCLLIINFLTVDCIFSFSISCLMCNSPFSRPMSSLYCQPHNLRCVHDRWIHMLHTCDCLFPFFIYEHFTTIISPELNVLFQNMPFQPICLCKCLIMSHTQRLILFMRVLAAVIF